MLISQIKCLLANQKCYLVNLNGYIYYKVENDSYEIREATLAEVNDWYENIRPTEPQFPIRDLSFTEILPLDVIGFEMSTAFGAKCSNVSTMRTFEFPNGTIPCLLYTSPSPRDGLLSRMPSSA